LGTLYQRITLPESTKYKAARALKENPDLLKKGLTASDTYSNTDPEAFNREKTENMSPIIPGPATDAQPTTVDEGLGLAGVKAQRAAALSEFVEYFSEWKHAKLLFGTAPSFLARYCFPRYQLESVHRLDIHRLQLHSSTWTYLHDNTVGN